MISERTKLLLLDMRDYAQKGLRFLGGASVAQVEADEQLLFALNRAVEIVGEAASKIDPAERNAMPTIPWREAIFMRNLLIHGYDHIDIPTVVSTIRDDFPVLITEIERLLNTGA